MTEDQIREIVGQEIRKALKENVDHAAFVGTQMVLNVLAAVTKRTFGETFQVSAVNHQGDEIKAKPRPDAVTWIKGEELLDKGWKESLLEFPRVVADKGLLRRLKNRRCYGGYEDRGQGKDKALVLLFPPVTDVGPWHVLYWHSLEDIPDLRELIQEHKYDVMGVGVDAWLMRRVDQIQLPGEPQGFHNSIRVFTPTMQVLADASHGDRLSATKLNDSNLEVGRVGLFQDQHGNYGRRSVLDEGHSAPVRALLYAAALYHSANETGGRHT